MHRLVPLISNEEWALPPSPNPFIAAVWEMIKMNEKLNPEFKQEIIWNFSKKEFSIKSAYAALQNPKPLVDWK